MRKQIAILAFLGLAALVAQAQDPIFSQFYAMPLQINPGFAGSSFAPRVGMAYRNQWTGFSNAYRTYALFYEQQLDHFNSGIGFNLQGDNAGDGILRSTAASVNYAYRLSVDDGLTLKLGIEAGARQVNLDWEKLIFPDQLDPLDGIVLNSGEIRPDVVNRTMLDLGAGLLAGGRRWYAGFAMKHLNTPDERIILVRNNLAQGLPILYTVQGGAELFVKENNKIELPSFLSPNFLFVAQGPFKQLNAGAYGSFGFIYFGAWYRTTFRNSDAVILLAGFRQGVFKMGISYDATISGLAGKAGSTFELTLGMAFDQSERLRKRKKSADLNDCLRMFR